MLVPLQLIDGSTGGFNPKKIISVHQDERGNPAQLVTILRLEDGNAFHLKILPQDVINTIHSWEKSCEISRTKASGS
jgi:hypothetical protein